MRTRWLLMSCTLILAAMGANCIPPLTDPPADDDGVRELGLRKFESADELRAFLSSQATARYSSSVNTGPWFFNFFPGSPVMGASEGMADDAAGGDRGFSTTNIQEAGVDESDLVKNNGEYIYRLGGAKVHVLKATPVENMAEVAAIAVDPGASSLYLRGNTLVVLSQVYSNYYGGWGWTEPGMGLDRVVATSDSIVSQSADMVGGPWADGSQSTVSIFDVTDPANPVSLKTLRFEGDVVSSRMVGGKLHLVMQTYPRLPDTPTVPAIQAMSVEEWMPDVEIVSADGSSTTGDVVSWEGTLRPFEGNGYGMTIVATLDIDNPDAELATTAVTANVGTLYASTEALYLTDTQYTWDTTSARQDTMIHKLAFTETGTDYIASGLVPGRPLNQYSLGEYNGHLRIATTNEMFVMTGEDLSSGVYVLGVNGSSLDTLGKVENIAPGEKIYAARFIGDRGFLVTFRRIDPLFTMDLSDPANPAIVGELKVPGYSDHIQLLDENHLLTIGRETEESGQFAWVQGVLLTIFDITDMANPQVLKIGDTEARVEIGGRGTYSEANADPKAFNYFAEKDVLAFPINLYEGDTTGAAYGNHAFTGLYVYRVTVENGFEFLGRIASAEGATGNGCFSGYYGTTRGVFIGDYVYSVTERGAKVSPLAAVSTPVGEVTFVGALAPITTCYWAQPDLALPPSSDLR